MISPDFNTFCQLATQGNLVPVYREIMADMVYSGDRLSQD